MYSQTTTFVLLFSFFPGFNLYEYCHMDIYCEHIVCHPEQMKHKDIKQTSTNNFQRVVMSRKMRKMVVDAHNEKRNEISCGKIRDNSNQTYPKAVQMREVKWDKELEYIAGIHAEQCVFAHDDCRRTSKYKHPGQNLAMRISSGSLPSPLKEGSSFVTAWYEEYKDASVGEVDAIGSTKTKAKIGHFTVMVNDRVAKIGCALTRCYVAEGRNMNLFTCDYSYTNMRGRPMYVKGNKPASSCDKVHSKKSSNYDCLCAHSDYHEKD